MHFHFEWNVTTKTSIEGNVKAIQILAPIIIYRTAENNVWNISPLKIGKAVFSNAFFQLCCEMSCVNAKWRTCCNVCLLPQLHCYIFMNKFSSMLPPTVEASFLCKRRPYVLCLRAYLYFLHKISCGSRFFRKLKTEKLKKLIKIFGSLSVHISTTDYVIWNNDVEKQHRQKYVFKNTMQYESAKNKADFFPLRTRFILSQILFIAIFCAGEWAVERVVEWVYVWKRKRVSHCLFAKVFLNRASL